MELVKNNKQEDITSIHNSNFTKENKGIDKEFEIFANEIYPCMSKKEQYEVFYGNPSTERLEEIMERVVTRSLINKEILLEKLS
ncbi:hypothetical protein AAXE64_08125 [Priestia megaterium]